jgi:hypothetical protein
MSDDLSDNTLEWHGSRCRSDCKRGLDIHGICYRRRCYLRKHSDKPDYRAPMATPQATGPPTPEVAHDNDAANESYLQVTPIIIH